MDIYILSNTSLIYILVHQPIMAEGNDSDSEVIISPEILSSPVPLKPGDPIYCTIPKLGWIKGHIGTQPYSKLSMVHNNGVSYQFIDLSDAPIVSLWAPQSIISVIPSVSPSLLHQRKVEFHFKSEPVTPVGKKNLKTKGNSIKKILNLPNKLKSNKNVKT